MNKNENIEDSLEESKYIGGVHEKNLNVVHPSLNQTLI